MKQYMKQLILSACAFILLGNIHFASAETANDTETLLNWAENTYPQYFPNHQITQSIEPLLYRFYPDTGIYAGVNRNDNNAYVLGGPWGDNPTLIDSLSDLIVQIANSGGNSSIPACNTANAPSGIFYTQNGNVVNVTTNGNCIPLPDSNNLCETPPQTSATGISVLTTTNVISSAIRGVVIEIDIPGFPNPFESFAQNFSNNKHCTINVPAEGANLIINSDICYDMTSAFDELLGSESVPGITITPPITLALKDTVTNQIVPDCFATDAQTVYDAFAKKTWIKKDGSFVEVSN